MDWKGKRPLFRHFLSLLDQLRRLCSSRLAPPLFCTVTLALFWWRFGLLCASFSRPDESATQASVCALDSCGAWLFWTELLAPQPPTNLPNPSSFSPTKCSREAWERWWETLGTVNYSFYNPLKAMKVIQVYKLGKPVCKASVWKIRGYPTSYNQVKSRQCRKARYCYTVGLNCFAQHSMLLSDDGLHLFPWPSFFISTIHVCRKDLLPKNNTSEGDLGNNSIALYLLREFQRAQFPTGPSRPSNTKRTTFIL